MCTSMGVKNMEEGILCLYISGYKIESLFWPGSVNQILEAGNSENQWRHAFWGISIPFSGGVATLRKMMLHSRINNWCCPPPPRRAQTQNSANGKSNNSLMPASYETSYACGSGVAPCLMKAFEVGGERRPASSIISKTSIYGWEWMSERERAEVNRGCGSVQSEHRGEEV